MDITLKEYFYPRSPCGERRARGPPRGKAPNFYPRSPCGERLPTQYARRNAHMYFYPRSPCGERQAVPRLPMAAQPHFYPRSPCGERHGNGNGVKYLSRFLSTLSLRRATPTQLRTTLQSFDFYPRSPCGERPISPDSTLKSSLFLSTLSLRRATVGRSAQRGEYHGFLSTLSLRRATESRQPSGRPTTYFYPRSPCGERPTNHGQGASNQQISIHALLAESDSILIITICTAWKFLSTLSLRRATNGHETTLYRVVISIHALLAESDPGQNLINSIRLIISIHALLAESDPILLPVSIFINTFLSTLSLRRATTR